MSAENELTVFRMENGEWWIVSRSCGMAIAECQGECHEVVAKHPSYWEAVEDLDELGNEDSDRYCYTEHGVHLPTEATLMQEPPRFLHSHVYIRPGLRECECVDSRDIYKDDWWVYEQGSRDWKVHPRVIGKNLSYAQAVTLASTYGTCQPGECTVQLPTHFRRFYQYPDHECFKVDSLLDIPGRLY